MSRIRLTAIQRYPDGGHRAVSAEATVEDIKALLDTERGDTETEIVTRDDSGALSDAVFTRFADPEEEIVVRR